MPDMLMLEFIKQTECSKRWIIVFNKIYDIQYFVNVHPGGAKIISAYIGRDATDAWVAMHPDKNLANKFLKPLLIGNIIEQTSDHPKSANNMIEDFREMRKFAERNSLFNSKFSFFLLQYIQIILFEIAAWLNFYVYGIHPVSFLLSALLITISQAQAGWTQHDYGHLSVFNTRKLNKMLHEFVVGHLKGASSSWWNFRHNLHHSKPNIIKTDPDIDVPYLFLLGTKMPVEWAKKRRGFMPYNYQHDYFFLFGPPILLPIYFHYENMYFIIKRWKIRDLLLTVSFFVKFFLLYGIFFDSWISVFGLYMTSRFFESFWFTMVTQMSHLPMEVDCDQNLNWTEQQLKATRNVTSNLFNDWFTGHLNFQIEHHLFPDMPRHNYHLIKPKVQEYCQQYNLEYIEKPLQTAFADIIRSLKKSGTLWIETYKNPG